MKTNLERQLSDRRPSSAARPVAALAVLFVAACGQGPAGGLSGVDAGNSAEDGGNGPGAEPRPRLDLEPEPFAITSTVGAFLVRIDDVEWTDGPAVPDVEAALEGRGFHVVYGRGAGLFPFAPFGDYARPGRWVDAAGRLADEGPPVLFILGPPGPDDASPVIGTGRPVPTHRLDGAPLRLALGAPTWNVRFTADTLVAEPPFDGTVPASIVVDPPRAVANAPRAVRLRVTVLPDRLPPSFAVRRLGPQPWSPVAVRASEPVANWLLDADGNFDLDAPTRLALDAEDGTMPLPRAIDPNSGTGLGLQSSPPPGPLWALGTPALIAVRYHAPDEGWRDGTLRFAGGLRDLMGNAAPDEREPLDALDVPAARAEDLRDDPARFFHAFGGSVRLGGCAGCFDVQADDARVELYAELAPAPAPRRVRLRHRLLTAACWPAATHGESALTVAIPLPDDPNDADGFDRALELAPRADLPPGFACGSAWFEDEIELPAADRAALYLSASGLLWFDRDRYPDEAAYFEDVRRFVAGPTRLQVQPLEVLDP